MVTDGKSGDNPDFGTGVSVGHEGVLVYTVELVKNGIRYSMDE